MIQLMRDLGIFAWFGYELPLSERLKLIADAGFTSTCLWLGPEEELVRANKTAEMVILAKSVGLTIDNVHAPYTHCNGLWMDASGGADRVIADYTSALEFCAEFEIPNCVVHITRGTNPPPKGDFGLRIIKDLLLRAEALDVILAVENTGRPDHLDFLFSNVESRHLGFCYDSSHDFLPGKSHGEILKRWGGLLETTHFSDNCGEMDDHALPGDGTIDWEIINTCFPIEHYQGVILLEVVPQNPGEVDPPAFLCAAYERAEQIRKKLANKAQKVTPDGAPHL